MATRPRAFSEHESMPMASLRRSIIAASLVLWMFGCGGPSDSEIDPPESARTSPFETKLRVKVDVVRLASLEDAGNVTGTVHAFHRARITAETQGRVVKRVVEPGADLVAGDVLVELESSRLELEMRRTKASLQAARTVLAHAKREFERGERLVAESAISAQRRDDIRLALDRARDDLALAAVARDTAQRNLADARIVAPFDGSVDSIEVSVGDFVSSGSPVATMVDLSRVRIFGGVTAREAARLTPGTQASISFSDLGGQSFDATLKSVGRVADASDGTYEIELWMENAEASMRDGLVARIELPSEGDDEYVLTRRDALLRRDGRPEVFVVVDEGGRSVARSRTLRTGRSDGDWVEILDGLAPGERVIYDGQFALDDGSVVEIDGATRAPSPKAKKVAEPSSPLVSATHTAPATPLAPSIATPDDALARESVE